MAMYRIQGSTPDLIPLTPGTIDAVHGMETLESLWAGHNHLSGTLDPLAGLE